MRMNLLRALLRGYLVKRIFRALTGRQAGRGRRQGPYAIRRRPSSRRRDRVGLLPFPHYSTRTRRGTRVSVGGCCLPVPLGLFAVTVGAFAARRRMRRPA